MATHNTPSSPTTAPAGSFTVGRVANIPSQPAGNQFVDRRQGSVGGITERRQFGSSHGGLTESGKELALAIDQYKLQHHRRYITCDEMLLIIAQLGYQKN